MQVKLTLFAFTGSAILLEDMNAKSVRLTCTSQPTDSLVAKLKKKKKKKKFERTV